MQKIARNDRVSPLCHRRESEIARETQWTKNAVKTNVK